MNPRYFKLCQRCEKFFYSEADYRSHSCVMSQIDAVQKNVDETKKPPKGRTDKHKEMLQMKKELEARGVTLPVTATYEMTLEAYRKEFDKQ